MLIILKLTSKVLKVEKNKISLFTAILININIMVGAGIFIVPSLMAKKASDLSFMGWPLVGIIFLPVVLSIAKITNFFPEKSNFYNYSKSMINKTAGFISGWFYFLGFASISAIQFIGLREVLINQIKVKIINEHTFLFNLIFIGLFCLINLLSLSLISKVQNSVTILKLIPLFFVILIMIFYYNPHLVLRFEDLPHLTYAIPLALFGFWGFEASCNISHLIKGGQKNVSRAILISFFSTVAIYTLFHLGLLYIMSTQNLINYNVPAFVQFLGIKSPILLNLLNGTISSIIVIAFVSSIFGCFLSNSSNLHTMTNENLFPFSSKLKKTNKNERPTLCIWIAGSATFIFLTIINNKEILNSMCNFGVLTSFALTITSLCLILLKKKLYKQMIIPILAFASCFFLIYYSWILIGANQITRITYTLPLLIFAILGIVMFKINEKKA